MSASPPQIRWTRFAGIPSFETTKKINEARVMKQNDIAFAVPKNRPRSSSGDKDCIKACRGTI